MNDTLKRLRNYRTIIAAFFVTMPVILRLATGEWMKSISDYAYADNNSFLPVLLTIAASIFVLDAVLNKDKWYNVILGLTLIGVALTPCRDYMVIHYTFAVIFFAGSVVVMIVFGKNNQLWINITLGLITISGFIAAIILSENRLLIPEWIALFPICFHYIAEAFGKIE